jgi:hypothetical protein
VAPIPDPHGEEARSAVSNHEARKCLERSPGNAGEPTNPPNPPNIWHKYQACTAITWPGRGNMLIGFPRFDRNFKTDRSPFKWLRRLEIFCR